MSSTAWTRQRWNQPTCAIVIATILTLVGLPELVGETFALNPARDIVAEWEPNVRISAAVPLKNGQYYVAGRFVRVGNAFRRGIVRFNADNTVDSGFVPQTTVNTEINGIAIQPDGKILIAGSFTRVGLEPRVGLARLNPDGTLDPSFDAKLSDPVSAVAIRADGKILMCDLVRGLRLLNADGSFARWASGDNGAGTTMAIQPDGKVIVGGGYSAVSTLVRFNADLTADVSFHKPTFADVVQCFTVARDNTIYVGLDSYTNSGLIRLKADGTTDDTFPTVARRGNIQSIAEQADGKIVAVGWILVDSVYRTVKVARFTSDGVFDWGVTYNPNDFGSVAAVLPDATILVGAQCFSNPTSVGEPLARYEPSGARQLAPDFALRGPGRMAKIVRRADGRFFVFGQFDHIGLGGPQSLHTLNLFQLNTDGTVDPAFSYTASDSAPYQYIDDAVGLPNGQCVVVGRFDQHAMTVNANGTPGNAFAKDPASPGLGSKVSVMPDGKVAVAIEGPIVNYYSEYALRIYNSDSTFASPFTSGYQFDRDVIGVAAQADGGLLVVGRFTQYVGASIAPLVRLKPDGMLDVGFSQNAPSFRSAAQAVQIGPSGKIYVIGGGTDFNGLIRLNADGTRDRSFAPVTGATNFVFQSDGKLIVQGTDYPSTPYVRRANSDGTIDNTFTTIAVNPQVSELNVIGTADSDEQLLYVEDSCTVRCAQIAGAPVVSGLPTIAVASAGTDVTLAATLSSLLPMTYQWSRDGQPIQGATSASYTLGNFGPAQVGNYTFTATNSIGASTQTVWVAPPEDPRPRIINLSIRATTGNGADRLIVGGVLGGNGTGGSKAMLFRGVGPTLGSFGVSNVVQDPMLELYNSAGTVLAQNDDWTGGFDFRAVGAFPFAGTAPRDAALYQTLTLNGAYSMHVIAKDAAPAVAMAEIYDATPPHQFNSMTPRLINGSARTLVGVGDNVLILGFVIGGTGRLNMLVRAAGPTLGAAPFNVPGVLVDPKLVVYDSNSVKLAENDNWGDNDAVGMAADFRSVGAFPFVDAKSTDAALVLQLGPGLYSAVVSGVGGTTGTALVELYELP